jgi:hypothetical protein
MNRQIRYFLIIGITVISLLSCSKKLRRYYNKRNTIEKYDQLNDSTLLIRKISANSSFGFSEEAPVMLGIIDVHKASENIIKFLNALEGPNGETIEFKRLKPCCPFKTKNFTYNVPYFNIEYDHKRGMLEKFVVSYPDSLGKMYSTILFFNLYDETNEVYAPMGFRCKVR